MGLFTITPITVIGLAGGAGVGKDTIAAQHFRPRGFYPIALADEIKRRVVASGAATYEEVYITKPPHIRELLQQEGTERGRDVYGEDYWVDQLFVNLGFYNVRWGFDKFVVPDVRFPNEVTRIQQAAGKVFRVHAPDRYAMNGLSTEARQHRSERALDGFSAYDAVITNDFGEETTVDAQVARVLGEAPNTATTDRFAGVRLGLDERAEKLVDLIRRA